MQKRALVIGGRGVIGRTLINELSADREWRVTGVSRRGAYHLT